MEKGIGLVEFLKKAQEIGLLPNDDNENSYYHSEDCDFSLHMQCLEVMAEDFGEVYFECLVDLLIAGLGFEFQDDSDIEAFLFGVRRGRDLESWKQARGKR